MGAWQTAEGDCRTEDYTVSVRGEWLLNGMRGASYVGVVRLWLRHEKPVGAMLTGFPFSFPISPQLFDTTARIQGMNKKAFGS